jgi:hypothetical protein
LVCSNLSLSSFSRKISCAWPVFCGGSNTLWQVLPCSFRRVFKAGCYDLRNSTAITKVLRVYSFAPVLHS